MNNLKELHESDKNVSAKAFFKGSEGIGISLQILAGEELKEHVSKTTAMLICVKGEAIYETENGLKVNLKPGDFIEIEAMLKHKVLGIADSQLVLIK